MPEAIFTNNPALLIPFVAILSTALVFIIWLVAHYWRRARQLEGELALKQALLARSMSVADIERIVWASAGGPPAPPVPEPRQVITDNEYALVEKMLDAERPVEEIERLIRAFKGNSSSAIQTIEAVMRG